MSIIFGENNMLIGTNGKEKHNIKAPEIKNTSSNSRSTQNNLNPQPAENAVSRIIYRILAKDLKQYDCC